MLELPPDHLIHHADVRLDDANHLSAYVLIHIVGHRNSREAVADEGDGDIYALEQALGVDAGEHEAALIQSLGPLRGSPDAHCREGMADRGEEAGLLGQGTRVRDHAEGVHLETVVIVEAERLVLNHAAVKFEPGRLQALARTRVAGVENRHVVLRGHLVDSVEKRQKVLLRVDILLAVGAQKDVLAFLQPKASMNNRSLNLRQVVMQHLRHRRASHIGTLLGQASISKIPARMLGISHIDIGNDIHNTTISFLRQAFVLASVAGLHVENGDVKSLGADD